jgi:hypothetical protein
VPALVAGLGDEPLGLLRRIEPVESRQPFDAREAVPVLAAALAIDEVIRERSRIGLGEPERADPR